MTAAPDNGDKVEKAPAQSIEVLGDAILRTLAKFKGSTPERSPSRDE